MFFDKLKNRVATLEAELTAVKAQVAKLEVNFGHLLGENDGLRKENDRLMKLGIAPAFPTRRHQWPDAAVSENPRQPL